ncbi:MAG: response regulator [Candidatus Brocadiae bacterium]|nr:response regulator [Candidatus Brocadiia bacterium]
MEPSRTRILIVDDEPQNRRLLGDMLEVGSYQVEAAEHGAAALAKLAEKPFHLVITDLRMPVMGGLELLEQVRISFPRMPVVVVTAHATLDTTLQALRLGATNFVRKPFSMDEIRGVVAKALRPWGIDPAGRQGIPRIEKRIVLEVESTPTVIDPVFAHIFDDALSLGFPEEPLRHNVYLALCEGVANAIDHGHKGDPSKRIAVEILIDHERLRITITDQGAGFDPAALPDPTDPDNLLKTRGRGVFLMRCYMDLVEYRDGGRTLCMEKLRIGSGALRGVTEG